MNEKYRMEIEQFAERFSAYQGSRIVLYGIGRYTATLLEGLEGTDFRFVGLMDKDPNNLGKTVFGLPVIDQETAEKSSDLVIINTSETYLNVIYDRIKHIKIPVFYKNGELARSKEEIETDNPYRNLSDSDLRDKIQKADVVSFDFFDTLFMRSVCSPRDVFDLMDLTLKQHWPDAPSFSEIRNEAKQSLRVNYSLDELYARIEVLYKQPSPFWETVKNAELAFEQKLLIPRQMVLDDLSFALEGGKEAYIISDMYLPESFYRNVLEKYGFNLPTGHILLSNVLDKSKLDGTLWRYYAETIVRGRPALHIGDNLDADVKTPTQYGMQTYHVPNAWDLLTKSSMREMVSHVCCEYGTAVMGCALGKLFEDPFALEKTDGTVQIKNGFEMGYCVFGPVLLTFLLWLLEQSREARVSKLIFMSRDGYFLKEDFEYLCKLLGKRMDCCYLGISRQLAMTAAIESRDDLMEFLSMPYTGSIPDMFEDRLGITGVAEISSGQLSDYVEKYAREIEMHIAEVKRNYRQYINGMGLHLSCAVVDLGYYGNNQRYLNKLSGLNMRGYYFNAHCSDENVNAGKQEMTACFQRTDDPTGENSQVLKRMIYLESFLTAPYGMVKAVDESGKFICTEPRKNQRYFPERETINRGVKQFMRDYVERFGEFRLHADPMFIDRLYGYCMGGALEFTENVKQIFYNDNAMMNRMESMLFY